MGAILSALPLSETDGLSNIPVNRADWLTSYADATGLAVVEVERLWNRFKQLTGSNTQTKLNPENNALPNELSNDIFVKNLLKHFPRSKPDNNIPFGYFLLVIQWLDGASIHDKLGAVYFYLNNGEPINAVMISKLLKHVYPETKEDEVKALSHQFMKQLGANENGQVNMQQFVTGVHHVIPDQELEELLHFDIIPGRLLDEANMLPSLQSSSTNIRSTHSFASHDLVTDDSLKQIAQQAARKNWSKLALTLGFLEYDIEAYKVKNSNDSAATILELLRMWHEQEGSLATKNRLKHCLEESGMQELAPLLN